MLESQQSPGRLRLFLFALLTISLTLIICLGTAENSAAVPAGGNPACARLPVTAENPVFHFTPERHAIFSRGWNFDMVNHRRVNNAGWINDQYYRKDDPAPLLAIIGDSYIEALMVPYAQTLYGRLAEKLAGRLRVYSFGASGAPLSQYLIWASHAVREYGARAVVINRRRQRLRQELHIATITARDGGCTHLDQTELCIFDTDRIPSRRMAEVPPMPIARSLVYDFFIFNYTNPCIEIRTFFFGSPAAAAPAYAGNTAAQANPARIKVSLAVIDAFFRDLPTIIRPAAGSSPVHPRRFPLR